MIPQASQHEIVPLEFLRWTLIKIDGHLLERCRPNTMAFNPVHLCSGSRLLVPSTCFLFLPTV